MTQIDELISLSTDLCVAQMKTSAEYVDAYETLKSALEAALNAAAMAESDAYLRGYNVGHDAALKPGEPMAFYDGKKFYGSREAASMCMADTEKLVPVYTAAPPAQTPPPRLTYGQVVDVIASTGYSAEAEKYHTVSRAIESAVRRSFGVNDE